jgi:hypothetical protein
MILTPEEERLIMNHRAEQARQVHVVAVRDELLQVAHAYRVWLDAERVGSSYSTFCNEFGYVIPPHLLEALPPLVYRNRVYHAVLELTCLATGQAERIVGGTSHE